ncbi:MAG: S8 family serine peptidase [Actinomycetota bacterium]
MRRALRTASVLVLLSMLGSTLPAAGASSHVSRPRRAEFSPDLLQTLSTTPADRRLHVVVTLRGGPTHARGRRAVVATLRHVARTARADLMATLGAARSEGLAGRATPLWIANAVSVAATPRVIRELATRPDVASIRPDAVAVTPAATPEANIRSIGAPTVWTSGADGSGVVVASLDSGVDATHPDLAAAFRGTPGDWYDPYGQHAASPVDFTGHGTGTMGVIVGGDAGGTSIGVAPGASWIAARIWNDAGGSSLTAIHQAFQWALDPDGDPGSADTPDIVNLSWSLGSAPGCDLSLQPDLQALRAAGILPVVAAGNFGPAAGSSVSPANYPEALAVGGVNATDGIWSGSGRGPTTCGGSTGVYPEVVAPAVTIRSADRFGLFQSVTGTSIAAPHVAGAAALLLSAHPDASPTALSDAITASALDLGAAGPDDVFGFGRLDVAAAATWLGTHQPAPFELSIAATGSHVLGGITVRDEDIVAFDGSSYSMVFDGSDVGITGEVDAYARLDAVSFLISLGAAGSVPGLGTVDDSDVVRFDSTAMGDVTAGSFSMYVDASDLGLTTDAEDVDAVDVLPDGRAVLSLTGKGSVASIATIQDEDLIALSPVTLGGTTSGTLEVYLDGSDVGLGTSSSEDVDAATVDPDGSIALSTAGSFKVPGATGTGDDAVACLPTSLGPSSACTFSSQLLLDGAAAGLAGLGLDAIERG